MKLSIVIVSYNVKYYLEQCLCSVIRACYGLDAEIWVVDNASSDGSVEYIRSRFPDVHFIENQENVGFSREKIHCPDVCILWILIRRPVLRGLLC